LASKKKSSKTTGSWVYNSHNIDADALKFYRSKAWKLIRMKALIRDFGQCQRCLRHGVAVRDVNSYKYLDPALLLKVDSEKTRRMYVHHKIPLKMAPELALDLDNLETLCSLCHSEAHPEKYEELGKKIKKEDMKKIRQVANVIVTKYQEEL